MTNLNISAYKQVTFEAEISIELWSTTNKLNFESYNFVLLVCQQMLTSYVHNSVLKFVCRSDALWNVWKLKSFDNVVVSSVLPQEHKPYGTFPRWYTKVITIYESLPVSFWWLFTVCDHNLCIMCDWSVKWLKGISHLVHELAHCVLSLRMSPFVKPYLV